MFHSVIRGEFGGKELHRTPRCAKINNFSCSNPLHAVGLHKADKMSSKLKNKPTWDRLCSLSLNPVCSEISLFFSSVSILQLIQLIHLTPQMCPFSTQSVHFSCVGQKFNLDCVNCFPGSIFHFPFLVNLKAANKSKSLFCEKRDHYLVNYLKQLFSFVSVRVCAQLRQR